MLPVIFSPSGLVLTPEERAFFRDADPAGYILFGRNVANRAQLRALTDELRALHGRDALLVSIDQEGGRVARMKAPEWDAYPAGQAFADLWQVAPASAIEAARVNAQALAQDLVEVGINVTYTPVLDLREDGAHDVIGDRALGSEPMQVAAIGRAVLDGLARAGVTGCIKHMPGHGRAAVDSHKELPTVTASAEELARDFEPFRTLADAPMGMTAHVRFIALDADNPATLSRTVIRDVIRGQIGFAGLLLTDDIDMQALQGTVPQRGARAIAAGCDIVLNCWGTMDDMLGLAEVLPPITDDAALRLERALQRRPDVQAADRAELLARRDSLFAAGRQVA